MRKNNAIEMKIQKKKEIFYLKNVSKRKRSNTDVSLWCG